MTCSGKLMRCDGLAINGGPSVRSRMLPYARQWISKADIAAVVACLESEWLTTGPRLTEFESHLASVVRKRYCAALCNGTAALHAAYFAAGIDKGDEVIVPAITFAATANAAVYLNAKPVFADVDAGTLLVAKKSVESMLSKKTKAIVAVDFAGQSCDYDALLQLADRHGLMLISDGCHSLGALYNGKPAGSMADMTAYSFHPVKPITSGEGGAVATDEPDHIERIRRFRNHGFGADHLERQRENTWCYEMTDLGYNYRLTDIHAALAMSQLSRLEQMRQRRADIARQYDEAFADLFEVSPLKTLVYSVHAHHLYVVRLNTPSLSVDRDEVFRALRAEGIGVNVHYRPVYHHPYYRTNGKRTGDRCPVSEQVYQEILSLPLYARMSEQDVNDVIEAVFKVMGAYRK